MLTGRQIGVYQIQALLGAGGMGEVYRARDTKLGRDVAIKFLPAAFTADPDRLARFEREARALASLNHPNIGAIYGVEESDGVRALVLELIDGQTLAELLSERALSVARALSIARQIAEALDAAHEKGIIHRDLKPANVKITPDGTVKVLDFGLAKMGLGGDDASAAATIDETREGVVLGTAAYMSPEQARGQAVDKRTDIWAFGCVLHEMLVGRKAFTRGTVSDTIAAILEREPDWSALPAGVPPGVRRILKRCLEKDVKKRARDIGDVRAELEDATPLEAAREAGSTRARRWEWVVAALVGVGIASSAAFLLRRGGPAPVADRRVQFDLTVAEQAADTSSAGTIPNPSPDGQLLAFIAGNPEGQSVVWVRPLDSTQARQLPGTEGAVGAVVWSPDGRWLAFFSDGKLKKIAPSGGPPQTIGAIPGLQDAAWGAGGEIIFRPTNRVAIFGIAETGGAPKPVTKLDPARAENSHRFLQFLPDGRRFLFTTRCSERENNALYVGSIDSAELIRIMPAQGRVTYVPGASAGAGTLLFYRDGALMAQPFALGSLSLEGEPTPVVDRISYVAASIQAGFRPSADGRTLIVEEAGANDDRLTWFNRDGGSAGTVGSAGDYLQPRISPSGDRVAYTKPDERSGNRDLWYTDLTRGITARLTTNIANDWYPVWSPDGRRLLFGSDREGGTGLPAFVKTAVDIGSAETKVPNGPLAPPWDWSRDGRWISSSDDGNIWMTPADHDGEAFTFLGTPFREAGGRFSPDSKWVTYVSNEIGHDEVYVRPFAGAPASPEGKIQVSNGSGDFPAWRADGRELYFMSRESEIYAVDTTDLGRADHLPAPSRLFKACPGTAPLDPPLTAQTYGYPFDTHDGQKFLVNCRVQTAGRYVVLLNPLMPR